MTTVEHCFFCRLRTGAKISVFISTLSCVGFMALCFTRYLQLREDKYSSNTVFLSLFTGTVVCYLITLVAAVVLFYGIVKRLTHLFMPWILCTTMSCLAVTILIVYVVISYRNAGDSFSKLEFIGFIYHVSHLIITMICTIGVWSYKRYLQKRIIYEYDYQREPTIPYNFMFNPPPYESSPPSYTSNSDLIIEGQERNFDPRPNPENSLRPDNNTLNRQDNNTLNRSQISRGSTPSLPPRRPKKPAEHVYGNLPPQRRAPPPTETEENQQNEQSNEIFQISSRVPESQADSTISNTGPDPSVTSSSTTVTTQNETVITRPLSSAFVYTAGNGPKVHKQLQHQKRLSRHHTEGNNSNQTEGRRWQEHNGALPNFNSSRNGGENY